MPAAKPQSEVKERPILFKPELVRAILDGRKDVTRRILKSQPPAKESFAANPFKWSRVEQVGEYFHIMSDTPPGMFTAKCPHGKPGDRLWVRETWAIVPAPSEGPKCKIGPDGRGVTWAAAWTGNPSGYKWKPSIHMERWMSRLTLEILSVRVERIQEISLEDIQREGVLPVENGDHANQYWREETLRKFAEGWDRINGKRSPWKTNEWVWRIEFKKADQ